MARIRTARILIRTASNFQAEALERSYPRRMAAPLIPRTDIEGDRASGMKSELEASVSLSSAL